jgi:hypothetical protein
MTTDCGFHVFTTFTVPGDGTSGSKEAVQCPQLSSSSSQ